MRNPTLVRVGLFATVCKGSVVKVGIPIKARTLSQEYEHEKQVA